MYKIKEISNKKYLLSCDECGFEKVITYNPFKRKRKFFFDKCNPLVCKENHYHYLINKKFKDKIVLDIYKKNNQYVVKTECLVCGLISETRIKTFLNNSYNNQEHSICKKILFKGKDLKKLKNFHERWRNMLRRCEDPKHKSYKIYNKYKISKEWHDFMFFYNDMWEKFEYNLQLDRINGNKGYSKENCRWVTAQENSLNRKTTKEAFLLNLQTKEIIEFGRNKKSLKSFSKENKISSTTIYDRLNGKVNNEKPINNIYMFFNTKEELLNYQKKRV